MVKQKQEQALEEQKESAQQSATQLIELIATDESEMARMSLLPSLPVPSSLIHLLEQSWKALRPV